MKRLIAWIFALFAFVTTLYLTGDLRVFIDIPSVFVAWLFPLLLVFSLFSPGRVFQAVRALRAPIDAGLTAAEQQANAEIFTAFGILSLSSGVVGSLAGLVNILANLNKPEVLGVYVALSMLTIFYALLAVLFVAYPASRILSQAAREATLLEETRAENALV